MPGEMPSINLIPSQRRVARLRKTLRRRWSRITVGWALLVVAACGGAHLIWRGTDASTLERIQTVHQRIADRTARLADVRKQTFVASEERRTAIALSDQPDWSLLLETLGTQVHEEVVLREIRVHPQQQPNGASPSSTGSLTGYSVQLRGLAKTQADVSQFVLRLQSLGLFDDVKLLRTGREPLNSESVASFDLACALGGGEAKEKR